MSPLGVSSITQGDSHNGHRPQKRMFSPRDSRKNLNRYELLQPRVVPSKSGEIPSEWMIHPGSRFRRTWDVLIATIVLYCSLLVPVYVAFGVQEGTVFKLLDNATDLLFMLDIALNFFTGYYDRGVVVMDQATVANSYCRGWLMIDVVSSVPVDILIGPRNLNAAGYNDSLIRLHILLRLVKISTLVRLQRISQRLQLAFYVKNSLVTIISAMLIMILYTHWFACGFIYLVRMEGVEDHADFKDLHVKRLAAHQAGMGHSRYSTDLEDTETMVGYYMLALYHAIMVMFTIDMTYRPTNVMERAFTVAFGGFGTGLLVYGTTVVVQILIMSKEAQLKVYQQLDDVTKLVVKQQLRRSTGVKLTDYLTHAFNRMVTEETHTLLKKVPRLLCEEALVDLYEPMLICGTFFPHMDRRIIGKVLYHLESLCFGPGEMVIARHKPASGLHVVCNGVLYTGNVLPIYIDEMKTETSWYRVGDIIGQASFINLHGEPAMEVETVRAYEIADAHRLSREKALLIADELPEPLCTMWRGTIHQLALLANVALECHLAEEPLEPPPRAPYFHPAPSDAHAEENSWETPREIKRSQEKSREKSWGGGMMRERRLSVGSGLDSLKCESLKDTEVAAAESARKHEHQDHVHKLFEELKLQLEIEKETVFAERKRVKELEEELGWAQNRLEEVEAELRTVKVADANSELDRAFGF